MKRVQKSLLQELASIKLSRNYIIALSLVAALTICGQVLIQRSIGLQQKDAHHINIAGKQSTYSQELSKLALLLISERDKAPLRDRLKVTLEKWKRHHDGLMNGDEALGLRANNNEYIASMFQEIETPFNLIYNNVILIIREQSISNIKKSVKIIIENETSFLDGMEKIVEEYEHKASNKVSLLRKIEAILFILTLFTLGIEAIFIFKPSVNFVNKSIAALKASDIKSRKGASQLKMTNKALKSSLKELTSLNMALEEATLMVKMNPSGMIDYVNNNFCSVLAYEENELIGERFNTICDKFLSPSVFTDMWNHVEEGKVWKKEIVLHHKEGQQLWMDMVSIPIQNQDKSITQCISLFNNISSKLEEKINEQRIKTASVIEGQEEERLRISRELHDGLGQMLSALKFNMGSLKLVDTDKEKRKLEGIKKLLQETITEIRKISFNLMPSVLNDYGLVSALKILTEELTKHTGIYMHFELRSLYKRVDKSVEVTIYRTVQEAINNAVKYSESERIEVIMYCDDDYIHIHIIDEGKGFDLSAPRKKQASYGRGIINMRERTKLVKGDFAIDSIPNQGTKVHIKVPL